MSYLNRDERREVILQAAMRVALAEGFTAMTVRRIASEADVAAGQVHHHFSSAGELKALAWFFIYSFTQYSKKTSISSQKSA